MQSGYRQSSGSRAHICGLPVGGMARGMPDDWRVFVVCWMNPLPKSPVPAQRKPKEWVNGDAFDEVLMERALEICQKVRECALNTEVLEQRRAILSIILSCVHTKFDHAYTV